MGVNWVRRICIYIMTERISVLPTSVRVPMPMYILKSEHR